MNSIQDFIDSLGLPEDLDIQESGSEYIIIPEDSTQFSDIYNAVSLNKDLQSTRQDVTEKETHADFTDGYFEVCLEADFDRDKYMVRIGEK